MKDPNEKYKEIEKEEDESADVSNESDEKVLKDPQKFFSEGIETEEYDIAKKTETLPEDEKKLKEKEGLHIGCSFNGAEIKEGLKIHYRNTVYRRNAIYSLILIVIFLLYMYNVIKGANPDFSIFMACVCIAVIFFLWILPARHIKKMAEAADESKETLDFQMTVYDDCVWVNKEKGGPILKYHKDITSAYETADIFLLSIGKERVYIIPKRCLKEGQEEILKNLLRSGMNTDFISAFAK